jgi:hypothetical protein
LAALTASHARVCAALRATQRRLKTVEAAHERALAASASSLPPTARLHASLTAAVAALADARAALDAADARLASRDATVDGLRRAVASTRAAAAHARLAGARAGVDPPATLDDVLAAALGGAAAGDGARGAVVAVEGGWFGAVRDAGDDAEGSGCE